MIVNGVKSSSKARASIRPIFHPTRTPIFPSPIIPSDFTIKFQFFSSSSDSFPPDNNRISPYHSIFLPLQPCRRSMTQLLQIQSYLIKSGFFQYPFPARHIFEFHANFGDPTVLLREHITFSVNEAIKDYSETSNNPHQSVLFYFEMLQKGFDPNSYTFTFLMKSCKKMIGMSRKATGQKCHGQAIKYGEADVLQVENSLIHMYSSFGLIDSAWRVFEEMSTRDLVSWNSIIDGYAKLGEMGIAHKIFDKMPIRNVVSWNIMMSGYLKAGNPGCALKLFREMLKTGLKESETTIVNMLAACGRSARLKEGRSVHGSLIKNFLKSSLILDTALIDMYSKCKRVDSAKRVFDSMVKKNLVCWNTMIMGHCLHGRSEDGINLFEEMVGSRDSEDKTLGGQNKSKIWCAEKQVILPDEVTFLGVLCACARSGSIPKGKFYFNQMIDLYHIKPTFAHYWCMANLYAGAGFLQEAEKILMTMSTNMREGHVDEEEDRWLSDDSMLWGSLLGLCRFRGDVDLGEKIAMSLIESEPDKSSWYMLLLNIYAAAGRWQDALKVKEMAKERGVRRKLSCSLFDLNEVVHKFKLGENSNQPEMTKVYDMVDELAQRLNLPKRGAGRKD